MNPFLRTVARPRHVAAVLLLLTAACKPSRDVTVAPDDGGPAKSAEPPPSGDDGRLPRSVRPTRYALSIVLDPAKERFTGDVTIDLEILEKTSYVVLHGRALSVLRAEVTLGGTSTNVQVTPRPTPVGNGDDEELVVRLPSEQAPGPLRLHLAYSAALGDGLTGAFRVKDGEDWYAYTQFEPMDARRAMPCFDEPEFKTPFDLKITVPKGQLAISNMPEASRVLSEDGRRTTFTFDSSPPLPTYLVAFAAGPLEVRESKVGPTPLRVITTKGKSRLGGAALTAAAANVQALARYFDMPFPYPKLDLVAIPEFGAGAMENAGMITYREDILLLDESAPSSRARNRMDTVVAHEIAHHWFGNLVTMPWWDDLWLNEGVATFFETRIAALRKIEVDPTQQLLARTTAMSLDALDSSRPVRMPVRNANDAEASFDPIVYDKGARVVDMLEGWLGEDAFRDGLRKHVRAHPHGTATAADLFAALGEAGKQDVAGVATTFLDRPGVPLVRATLKCEGATAKIALAQSRYRARPKRTEDNGDKPWSIPVCVDFEGRTAPACILLTGREAELSIPTGKCPKWFYPNASERGYYRSALPDGGFRALAKAGKAVDARQRFGALDNAWALVESSELTSDVVFDVLEGLRADRSRLVVERVATTLRDLDRAVVDDRSRPAFTRFVAAQLLPIVKEVGWDPAPSEPEDRAALRRSTLSALAQLAPDRIAKDAEPRARAYLDAIENAASSPSAAAAAPASAPPPATSPGKGATPPAKAAPAPPAPPPVKSAALPAKPPTSPAAVDPEVSAIALRAAARGADNALWGRMESALRVAKEANERNALIVALASVQTPALLERSLDLAVSGSLKKQEAVTLLVAAGERSDTRVVVVGWLQRRFADFRQKVPTASLLVRALDSVAQVCDAEQQSALAKFLPKALENVDGADRRVEQILETATRCATLRARESERAAKRLP